MWIAKVMGVASRLDSDPISFGSIHALLGAPLSRDVGVVPLKLWQLAWGIMN